MRICGNVTYQLKGQNIFRIVTAIGSNIEAKFWERKNIFPAKIFNISDDPPTAQCSSSWFGVKDSSIDNASVSSIFAAILRILCSSCLNIATILLEFCNHIHSAIVWTLVFPFQCFCQSSTFVISKQEDSIFYAALVKINQLLKLYCWSFLYC